MSVKIEQGRVYNIGSGSVSLTEAQLFSLTNRTTVSGINFAENADVALEIQLHNRFVLSEIRYWGSNFTSLSVSSSQDGGSSWNSHSFSDETTYATVSGSLGGFEDWPTLVRFNHTATGGAASIHEIELQGSFGGILPVEDYVGRGIDVDSNGLDSEPSVFYITNTSSNTTDVFCFVDLLNSVSSGSTIGISTASGGPFVGPHEAGYQFPRDFSWSTGIFSGTTQSGTSIILTAASGTGHYTTPILDIADRFPVRFFWESYDESGTTIDTTSDDSVFAAQVRFSNTMPTGGWVSGQLPSPVDPIWGTSGTLLYREIPNDEFMEVSVGQYRYVQAFLQFNTPTPGTSSRLTSLGFEEATTASGVAVGEQRALYAKTSTSSYSVGDTANIITLSFE